MSDHQPRFSYGEKVRPKAEPSKVSTVLWQPELRDDGYVYAVNFGRGPEYYPEQELESCAAASEPREPSRNTSCELPFALDPSLQDKSVALLRFLKDAAKLRRARAPTYGREAKLLWFWGIPKEEPECRSPFLPDGRDQADERWLEVRKRRMPARPSLPQGVVDWVRVEDLDQIDKEPELRPEIRVVCTPKADPGGMRVSVVD